MKFCSRCRVEKTLSAFGVARKEKDGLRSECRECRQAATRVSALANRERAKRWKLENPERAAVWKIAYRSKKRITEKAWRDKNRSRKRAIDRAGYQRHRTKRLAAQKAKQLHRTVYLKTWAAKHPGYFSENVRRWKAKYPDRAKITEANKYAKRKSAPGELTARQWKEICLFYGHACGKCKASASVRPLTIDHWIPIARGGSHDWRNVWPLCLRCNQTKHTQVPPEGAPPHVAVLEATAVLTQEGLA